MWIIYYLLQKAVNTMYVQAKNLRAVCPVAGLDLRSRVLCEYVKEIINLSTITLHFALADL